MIWGINGMVMIVVILTTIGRIEGKVVNGTVTRQQMRVHQGFYYLGKMDFGVGKGMVYLEIFNEQDDEESGVKQDKQKEILYVGLLIDQKYDQFHLSTSCLQKQSLLFSHQPIILSHALSLPRVQISHQTHQHLYYIFLFNCEDKPFQTHFNSTNQSKIKYRIDMINNGSHFGEDEQIYGFCWVMALISSVLYVIVKYTTSTTTYHNVNNQTKEDTNYPLYFLKIGNFLLTLGFILKVFHLYLYNQDGRGLFAIDFISSMLKALSEATVLTILISLSWGWSINYYKCYYLQLIIPCGISCAVIHMLLYPLSLFIDGDFTQDHHYDHIIGTIILYYRSIIFIAIIIGLVTTYSSAKQQKKGFVWKFGVMAIFYAGCDVMGVILCEMLLPKYMQQEVMMGVSDMGHWLVNVGLVYVVGRGGWGYGEIRVMEEEGDKVQ